MSLLTITRYRAITGDQASPAILVSARIEDAQDQLTEALGRAGVEQASYTERLRPDRAGMVWPTVTPILTAPGWTIDGHGLLAGPVVLDDVGTISVTYTGGWVERSANPSATNRLPACIEEDLAWAVRSMVTSTNATGFPQGAVSVTLGDASVNFGPNGAPAPGAQRVTWSRRTLRYAHRVARATALGPRSDGF
jgi:hypothetical protein